MLGGAETFLGFVPPSSPRWNEALGKAPHDLFHLPGYLAACADQEGGEPLAFLLDTGTHGMLVPLIRRSLEGFGPEFTRHSDVTSPYGYPSPLYWGPSWEDRLPELHAHFEAHLAEQGVVSAFLRLHPFLGATPDLLGDFGEVVTHGPTVFLDLRNGEESWRGINAQNRRFISRQREAGCQCRIDAWETLDAVIDAYYETMQRLQASDYYFFPRSYFHALRAQAAPHFHLATTYSPTGEITGGLFFSEVGGLLQYFLTGAFSAFTELSPNKLMIDTLRLWGVERGHHTLHLGGGLGGRKDNLFEFKVRFSKHLASFSTLRKVILPEPFQALVALAPGAAPGHFPPYRGAARPAGVRA